MFENFLSTERLLSMLYAVPALLIALTFHEYAHAYVSYKLGDDTAKNMGRLTLNPLAHLDLIGTIFLILVGFGWAKPVSVNMYAFKNRKRGMLLTAFAGPITNFFLAIISAFLFAFYIKFTQGSTSQIAEIVFFMLYYLLLYNIVLCVFNFIPLPPLDGSKMLAAFLPDRLEAKFYQYQRQLSVILILLMVFGVIGRFVSVVGVYLAQALLKMAFAIVGG